MVRDRNWTQVPQLARGLARAAVFLFSAWSCASPEGESLRLRGRRPASAVTEREQEVDTRRDGSACPRCSATSRTECESCGGGSAPVRDQPQSSVSPSVDALVRASEHVVQTLHGADETTGTDTTAISNANANATLESHQEQTAMETQETSAGPIATQQAFSTRKIRIDTASEASVVRPRSKLVLIIDNSYSMEDKQQKLASSMGNLIERLRGFDIDIAIYTTTNTLAYSMSTILKPTNLPQGSTVDWHGEFFSLSGERMTGPFGTSLQPNPPFRFLGTAILVEPKQQSPVTLRPHDSDAQFTNTKATFLSAIGAIGTSGSDQETGLCTLAYVTELRRSPQGGLDLRKGDLVGYIILSDEDHSGIFNEDRQCVAQHQVEVEGGTETRVRTEKLMTYDPRASFQVVEVGSRVCNVYGDCPYMTYSYRDGVALESREATFRLEVPCDEADPLLQGPDGSGQACESRHWSKLVERCAQSGFSPPNQCHADVFVDFDSSNGRGLVEPNAHPCTEGGFRLVRPSSAPGQGHIFEPLEPLLEENWLSYMQKKLPERRYGFCQRWWERAESYETPVNGTVREERIAINRSPAAIHAAAAKISGDNGYFISAIIHDTDQDSALGCNLQSHERVGLAYKQVVDFGGQDHGRVTSICSPNYSLSVEPIEHFVKATAARSYLISDFKDSEMVTRITVIRGAATIEPTVGSDVEIVGARLTFAEGFLLPGDVIETVLSE